MASEQQQTLPNQQVGVIAPTNPAPSDITVDRLGNANRIFLTKRKDRQSSSAAGSPPNAVKTEPGFRAEALSSLQVYQPTHAGSQTSASRLYSPLFTSVKGDSPQRSSTPTGSSSQDVSARLSPVRLASNMDFNCPAPNTTLAQIRNINPQKSIDIGGCITGAMVTVMVGPALEPKMLHMKVLCHQSGYFKDKYEQHEFASGISNVTMENVKLSVFQHWTACAYGNPFAVALDDIEKAYQLYYLASDLRSPNLQDTAMDAIRKAYRDDRGWPTQQRIRTAYQNTSIDSPVRCFLTECVYFSLVRNKTDTDVYFGGNDFPCDFVRDYVRMSQEMTRSAENLVDPRSKEGCEFHMHTTADLCSA